MIANVTLSSNSLARCKLAQGPLDMKYFMKPYLPFQSLLRKKSPFLVVGKKNILRFKQNLSQILTKSNNSSNFGSQREVRRIHFGSNGPNGPKSIVRH